MHSPHDLTGAGTYVPVVAPLPMHHVQVAPMRPHAIVRRRRRLHVEGTTLMAWALFALGIAVAAAVAWFTGAVYSY